MRLLADLRSIRSNRPLTALVAASAVSSFGDWLYLAAVPIIVFQETQDAALLGLAAAGRLLPFLLLSMPAGLVADRFDRRRILLATESTRAVLMFAMAVAYVLDLGVGILIAISMASAALGTFAMPAQSALMPELARDDTELGVANATSAALDNVGSIGGPMVAGLLVLTTGLGAACALNGLTFVCVVVLLAATRPPPRSTPARQPAEGREPSGAPGREGPADGGRRPFARPTLQATVLDAAVSFGAGSLGVMPVLIAVDHVGAGEALAGLIGAAGGIGASLGGLAAASLLGRRLSTVVILAGLTAAGAVTAVALVPSAVVAVAGVGFALAAVVLLDALNLTWLQRSVPASHLGRAFGVMHTSAAVWLMLGSAVPPIIAASLGVQLALHAVAAGCLGLAALSLTLDLAVKQPRPLHLRATTRA